MKIAALTSSRADFGIYLPLLKRMKEDPFFDLKLVVFGTHLSRFHGNTADAIRKEGFTIDYEIDTLMAGDSAGAIATSAAVGMFKFSDFWAEHGKNFDAVLCLGDRYEMFAAVFAALPFSLKLIHIQGGEKTLGAFDNVYRHAISHASQFHFATTEEHAERLRQLLDDPAHVYNSGSISLDNLKDIQLYTVDEFKKEWEIDLSLPTVLLTFHPETVKAEKNKFFAKEIVAAVKELSCQVLVTMPNADTEGNSVRQIFIEELKHIPNVKMVESLGTKGYFTALQKCLFVLGNSSSGIIEAASFKKYVINIGERQKGRSQSGNVLNIAIEKKAILKACEELSKKGLYEGVNVYQSKGSSAEFIINKLKEVFNAYQPN